MKNTTQSPDLTFFTNVKNLCAMKGISVTALGKTLGLSNATTAGWRRGSEPRGKTLKMLSEYFSVPVTYFFENHNSMDVKTVQDNHGIIGHAHAPVTINGSGTALLSEQEEALLDLFRKMNVVNQAKLLVYAESVLNGQT